MSDMFKDVRGFISKSEQVPHGPYGSFQQGTPSVQELYKKLMAEEYREFLEANGDAIEELDGCLDLIWVTLGYCIAKGWNVPGAWEEVWSTNMAKLQEDPDTGKIKRRPDGKILKPADWKAPDLTPFVRHEEEKLS